MQRTSSSELVRTSTYIFTCTYYVRTNIQYTQYIRLTWKYYEGFISTNFIPGAWRQVIGHFLTKGAAKGKALHGIVIEAIKLLENSGYFVDAIVGDGATWNRAMWSLFGVSVDKVTCKHIMDEERPLIFISDFPHLLKNVRNYITQKQVLHTPDGIISSHNWTMLLECDSKTKFGLKACPKLTKAHTDPKGYQKMSVSMAYDVIFKLI